MENTGQLSRRQILAAAGFIGLATLTGCGSGDDGGDSKDLSKKQNGAMKEYRAGQQFKATKALSFSLLHNDNPVYPSRTTGCSGRRSPGAPASPSSPSTSPWPTTRRSAASSSARATRPS